MGKGYESETNYENCVLKFMSIGTTCPVLVSDAMSCDSLISWSFRTLDNIHNIRESLDKLMELCTSGRYVVLTWVFCNML